MRPPAFRSLLLSVVGISFFVALYVWKGTIDICNDKVQRLEATKNRDIHRMMKDVSRGDFQWIYIITPTYKRLEQIAELTRLAQTLMHVPNVYWIVAEDTVQTNQQVLNYLGYTGIPYTYLLTPMPDRYKKNPKALPKGVANRNAGLQWIRQYASDGVFYFADDDNTYDIRLFEEIRRTKTVSMFPVGLLTSYGISTPIVKDGKFYDWYDGYKARRKFLVDMAGFAVNVKYFLERKDAIMPYKSSYEEDGFLKSLGIEPQDIEFLADNCTKVYVWHTQAKKNKPSSKAILNRKYDDTNLRILQKDMILEK